VQPATDVCKFPKSEQTFPTAHIQTGLTGQLPCTLPLPAIYHDQSQVFVNVLQNCNWLLLCAHCYVSISISGQYTFEKRKVVHGIYRNIVWLSNRCLFKPAVEENELHWSGNDWKDAATHSVGKKLYIHIGDWICMPKSQSSKDIYSTMAEKIQKSKGSNMHHCFVTLDNPKNMHSTPYLMSDMC